MRSTPPMDPLVDARQRPLRSLRISVTDRCNLRCSYCMPEEDYSWLARQELLSFEEISRLVDVFLGLGVARVRLTGGEPLLRRDLHLLVGMLAAKPGLRDLALTTNGLLLQEQARRLRAAGLHRVTISLDTLRPDRFHTLARRDGLATVLNGVRAAAEAGFPLIKIDTVVIRGTNEDELGDMLEFGRSLAAEVRFIEYMDVGGATRWSRDQVVTREAILQSLGARYGVPVPLQDGDPAPAERFQLPDGTIFGVIASTTVPFCARCDRCRLTADGHWYPCLYARQGLDLRGPLRAGASGEELRSLLTSAWAGRTDQGARDRLALEERGPLLSVGELRQDPRLEMHARGG